MPGSLDRLQVTDFRCLQAAELEPSPGLNLIVGANASGKTSLLEAIFVLGRGRSFRTLRRARLVRDGASGFTVAGQVTRDRQDARIGVRGSRTEPLEIRIDGHAAGNAAKLSEWLPVEAIDPEVHKLVEEGPERRRRYLDWGTFHVEHGFLAAWGRYRKALRQRNALLQRLQRPGNELDAWEEEMSRAGTALTGMRQRFVDELATPLATLSTQLLDLEAKIDFRPGWDRGAALLDVLGAGRERDLAVGRTLSGPHRAELVIELDSARARARVSRGQQKLLAASLILAQLQVLATAGQRRAVLLLDDPGAELDRRRVALLIGAVQQMDLQLFITALDRSYLPDLDARTFHMEQYEPRLMV